MRYLGFDAVLCRHVCVPGRRIGGGAGHARSTEEAGGAEEAEPRRADFVGLTMAHANHGLTAVLAVQLPWKTLHYSGLQGRYRAQQGGHVTFVTNSGRAAAASAASFMTVRHHPSTPSWSQ